MKRPGELDVAAGALFVLVGMAVGAIVQFQPTLWRLPPGEGEKILPAVD